jgi:pimeloyl-ACP methyl ester carboxylesterase
LAELIIKRVDLGPAHLIGHSYGALTALYMAYQHPELVRILVIGEPPVMSLLENNHKYSKDLYAIRENVQDAIRRGDMERAVRIFLDGVMRGILNGIGQDTLLLALHACDTYPTFTTLLRNAQMMEGMMN